MATHAEWKAEEGLLFSLLSDPDNTARQAYEVPGFLPGVPGRATFVIAPDGEVRAVHAAQLDFESHAAEALAAVRELRGD